MNYSSFCGSLNKQTFKVKPIYIQELQRSIPVKPYQIFNMIIDEEAYDQEEVTADFTYQDQKYSITFKKEDLELVNAWVFNNDTSLPANLSEDMIELIREDIKKRI